MQRFTCLMAAAALLAGLAIPGSAQARTSGEVAAAMAKKRGYTPTQTSCFVNIYQQHAFQGRNGRWRVGYGKRGNDVFRAELWNTCGISR